VVTVKFQGGKPLSTFYLRLSEKWEVSMRKRSKTNRLKAALKRKNVRKSLRKSKGERKYPT
jgi:hypothetical protein